jgi:hypothetical protein
MKIENTGGSASGSAHTSLPIETVDLETEFPDEKINSFLSKVNSLSRVFIRRHFIHSKLNVLKIRYLNIGKLL